MARKSCLTFLVLVTMFVFASSHKLLLVEKHKGLEDSITHEISPKDMVKGGVESKMKNDDMGNRIVRRSDEGEKFDGVGNKMVEPDSNKEKSYGDVDGDRDREINPDASRPSNPLIGLYAVPLPLPGADGVIHFQWGPVSFGFRVGSFNPIPPINQLYVVGSTYSKAYGSKDPNPSLGDNSQGNHK